MKWISSNLPEIVAIVSVIPLSLVGAVILFIIKERREAKRRRQDDARKLKAIRSLLARECNQNISVYKQLKRALEFIGQQLHADTSAVYAIEKRRDGDILLIMKDSNQPNRLVASLKDAETSEMKKFMREVAELDQCLFTLLMSAYDSISRLRHVRYQLFEYAEPEAVDHKQQFTGDFTKFASQALDEVRKPLEQFLEACADKEPVSKGNRRVSAKATV